MQPKHFKMKFGSLLVATLIGLIIGVFSAPQPAMAWSCKQPVIKSTNGLTVEVEFEKFATSEEKVEVLWGDGTLPELLTSNDQPEIRSHTYPAPGTYTITINVYNPDDSDHVSCSVKVEVKLPRPTLTLSCDGVTLTQERPDDGKNAVVSVVIQPPSGDAKSLVLVWQSYENGIATWHLSRGIFYRLPGEYEVTLATVDERSVKDLPVKQELDCPKPFLALWNCDDLMVALPEASKDVEYHHGTAKIQQPDGDIVPVALLFEAVIEGEAQWYATLHAWYEGPGEYVMIDASVNGQPVKDLPTGVNLNCEPPAQCKGVTVTPTELEVSNSVHLVATVEDAVRMLVSWGDGSAYTEPAEGVFEADHTFVNTGTFSISVLVLGRDGKWQQAKACNGEVTVSQVPPATCLGVDAEMDHTTKVVTFEGSGIDAVGWRMYRPGVHLEVISGTTGITATGTFTGDFYIEYQLQFLSRGGIYSQDGCQFGFVPKPQVALNKLPLEQTVQVGDRFTETIELVNTGLVPIFIDTVIVTATNEGIEYTSLTLLGAVAEPPVVVPQSVQAGDIISMTLPSLKVEPGTTVYFQLIGTVTQTGPQPNVACVSVHHDENTRLYPCAEATVNSNPTSLPPVDQPDQGDRRMFLPAVHTTGG